ncbi:amPTPR4c-like protein [Dinothrombium tinctorium]|uniref:protein-tyrosine-phosphatase n=1 Tax=Dinothrombium tinctorium TaxID=1965070 RepID=A0A3S3RTR4_9ACAR|nr:amPTPR4c-like protein [Dinothrombium tinctorium]RWS05581.1 amPTPR4c-like protein [Dinothrombium tinctorium]RWS05909.1 amPTPR4c-like protein [Dinothrombium tinctorium]
MFGHENQNPSDNKPEEQKKIDEFLRNGIKLATNRIKKEDLGKFVEENDEKIKTEYEKVPEGQYYRWNVGKRPENFPDKHRYDFSKAYDHNRVVLKVFADNATSNDYINANYIDGYDLPRRFIATQAPIPATVNDFWRMVFDADARTIVTLTRLVENNKTKCEKYWADEGTKTFGEISVTTAETENLPDLDIRHYNIERDSETREVIHFHFLGWPDTGTPTDPDALLNVIEKVRKSPTFGAVHPVVVHCSAGVGRTGTFLLLFNMIEMAEKSDEVDVYKYFAKLRTQRVNAIEALDQYRFVYSTLVKHLTRDKPDN